MINMPSPQHVGHAALSHSSLNRFGSRPKVRGVEHHGHPALNAPKNAETSKKLKLPSLVKSADGS